MLLRFLAASKKTFLVAIGNASNYTYVFSKPRFLTKSSWYSSRTCHELKRELGRELYQFTNFSSHMYVFRKTERNPKIIIIFIAPPMSNGDVRKTTHLCSSGSKKQITIQRDAHGQTYERPSTLIRRCFFTRNRVYYRNIIYYTASMCVRAVEFFFFVRFMCVLRKTTRAEKRERETDDFLIEISSETNSRHERV